MRFGLLGPLTWADDDGERAPPAGRRLRVLLAALLLRPDMPVSYEELAEVVWDRTPPVGAVETLRSYVRRLRRALGPVAGALVVARDPGYLIRLNQAELDVLVFEKLCRDTSTAVRERAWAQVSSGATQALALWRATPLLDIPCEVLREAHVPRLEQLRVQMLEDRAEAELNLGHHERLVPDLKDLTVRYPLRERLHAQLMVALARSGRQAEASQAYHDARQILIGELGIEPGEELRELHHRILTGDSTLTASITGGGGAPAVPRQLPAAVSHFTGRADMLRDLTDLAARTGMTDSVVISAISGAAGVGKTALAVQWAHQVAARFPMDSCM